MKSLLVLPEVVVAFHSDDAFVLGTVADFHIGDRVGAETDAHLHSLT